MRLWLITKSVLCEIFHDIHNATCQNGDIIQRYRLDKEPYLTGSVIIPNNQYDLS